MAIALIVYNFALWGALRQAFQPAYCLLVLCLLAYALTSSGALGQMLPMLDNNDRQRFNALFLAASAAAALLFARTFFERAVFSGWLRPASTVVMTALMTTGLAWAALAPWQFHLLDRLLAGAYLALLVLIPAVLIQAWRVPEQFPVAVRAGLGRADRGRRAARRQRVRPVRLEPVARQFDDPVDGARIDAVEHGDRVPDPVAERRARHRARAGDRRAAVGRYRTVDGPAQPPRVPEPRDRPAG
ncbi:7TM diverse intracellular signaling domain-containing protein [Sphingomonas aurantiaca]|uniref:7TM diverse intracellular signaling domain-containing protein n=1 Tax=Sphingomonas aurantiaca TaxID=185949 RepID=UPI002FE38C87